MSTTQQPAALRLAAEARNFDCSGYRGVRSASTAMMGKLQDCADMIRKQYAENEALQAKIKAHDLELSMAYPHPRRLGGCPSCGRPDCVAMACTRFGADSNPDMMGIFNDLAERAFKRQAPAQPAPAAVAGPSDVAKRRAKYLRGDTDAGRAYVAQFFNRHGHRAFDDYIRDGSGLAGDFARALASILALAAAPITPAPQQEAQEPFQQRVQPWLVACFGAEIASDRVERNHRFLEESLELVQACGCTASEAHQLVDYVFGRPVGESNQEVGGVMVTLAALCLANGLDMRAAGEMELARIWTKVEAIRAKQAAKPKHSPLPQVDPRAAHVAVAQGEALDAARYRMVRRGQHWSVIDGVGNDLRADALDAAIDRAAQEGK